MIFLTRHNYELFVTVKGEINPATGFVVDLKDLRDIINKEVIDKIDHSNINLDVDFMFGKLASTENLALAIWEQILPHLPYNVKLHCVKLYATPSICVEYFGN